MTTPPRGPRGRPARDPAHETDPVNAMTQLSPSLVSANEGRPRPGRWFLAFLALAAGTLVMFLAWTIPAGAAITHRYLYQITGFTPGVETGLAFDAAEGLYVADENAKVMERFAPGGAALPFECETAQCKEYLKGNEIVGTPTGEGGTLVPLREPAGVAVDQATGEVYVSEGREGGVVDIFAKTGEYLRRLEGACENPGETVGVGLCVKGRENAKGEEETTFKTFRGPFGLAFDQATNDLYIDDESVVDVVSVTNELVRHFGEGKVGKEGVLSSGPYGTVAVDEASGDAYVGDRVDEEAVLNVFGDLGEFIGPWWQGHATREGSFGTNRVFVGIDHHTSNHVFVGDNLHDVVDEFGASEVEGYVSQLTGTPSGGFGEVEGVGVAGGGDVFVAAGGVVDAFGPDAVDAGCGCGGTAVGGDEGRRGVAWGGGCGWGRRSVVCV